MTSMKRVSVLPPAHEEKELKERIVQIAYCGYPGETYYASEEHVVQDLILETLKRGCDLFPEFTAEALAHGRNEGFLKYPAQVGIVMLRKNTEILHKYFSRLLLIPSDLFAAYEFLQATTGTTGGRAWKTAAANWLNNNLTPFRAAKYPGNSSGFSLRDVIRVSHPNPKDKITSDLFKYIVNKGAEKTTIPYLKAVEELSTCSSAHAAHLIREFKIPHEVVTGKRQELSPAIWEALAETMPIMASLRFMNTIGKNLTPTAAAEILTSKFTAENIRNAKVLPSRLMTAAETLSETEGNEPLVELIRGAIEDSVQNMPIFDESTIVAIDQSASMKSTENAAKIFSLASMFGYALKKRNPSNVTLLGFSDRAVCLPFSVHDSVYTQASKLTANGNYTMTDRVLQYVTMATKNIVIITDGQQNNGSDIEFKFKNLLRTSGQDIKLFIIDVSPYRNSSWRVVDPDRNIKNCFYIYGLSEAVLRYVSLAVQGFGTLVNAIDAEVEYNGTK